jgi:hypothetical protein
MSHRFISRSKSALNKQPVTIETQGLTTNTRSFYTTGFYSTSVVHQRQNALRKKYFKGLICVFNLFHDTYLFSVFKIFGNLFLTSALDGGEWLASRPGRFTPRERAPGTHLIGGWMGARAGLDAVVRRKIIPSPYRDSNLRSSSP